MRYLLLIFFVFLLALPRPAVYSSTGLPEFDMGFIASRDTDIETNKRIRILGPFFEQIKKQDGKTFIAVRPFFSSIYDPAKDRLLREFLWPEGMIKKLRQETDWRFLPAFGHDFDNTDPNSRFRWMVLPVLFGGRDKNDENYFAVFPFAGKINEFLGRDKIRFILFPLYAYGSINDLKTHHILWPFISWTKGGNISRHKVFPFYGKSMRGDKHINRFILWPVWTSEYHNGPHFKGKGWMLFPLAAHGVMNDRKMWMIFPPFFKYSHSNKEKKLNCPWPFFQYSSGKVNKLYIWPIWGKESSKKRKIKSSFILWPIFSLRKTERGDYVMKNFNILPLVSYETKRENNAAKQIDKSSNKNNNVFYKHFKLWPIMSYKREKNSVRVRLLELWPAKDSSSIEKNLAPFWTLYSHVRNEKAKEDELLWGLYRSRSDKSGAKKWSLFPLFSFRRSSPEKDFRKWSFLMGMFGYKREYSQKTYRLLYFNIHSKGK